MALGVELVTLPSMRVASLLSWETRKHQQSILHHFARTNVIMFGSLIVALHVNLDKMLGPEGETFTA
jgi:hypothetical protein